MEYFQDTWAVLDSYFRENPYFLTKHHLDSYNDFVSNRVLKTIQALNPILVIKNQVNITHEIEVYVGGPASNEIFITKPTIVQHEKQRLMYPNEARLKDFTYQSEIYANILVRYTTKEGDKATIEEKRFEGMKIGAFPIMLHSKLCMLHDMKPEVRREMGECTSDCGGYFIIDGKEKVIVAQERIATNRIFISKSNDPKYSYSALIRCTSDDTPLFPKVVHFYVNEVLTAQKKQAADDDDEEKATKTTRIHDSVEVAIPYCAKNIPLFVLFRALGIESDLEILKHICDTNDDTEYMNFLRPSIVHAGIVLAHGGTQEDAINYIANFVEYKNVVSVKKILTNDLFPNVGNVFRHKAIFLGYLVGKLIKVCLGVDKPTDRDSYVYKRVDTSGFLMGNIFRDYYNQFRNEIRNNLDNQYLYGPWRNTKNVQNLVNPSNINFIFKPEIIEGGMKKSLKGMWGKSMTTGSTEHVRQGLVQDLSRISYLGFISHLRRVNTPIDPTSKVVAPHHLHSTQWGIMCPCESPDGGSIGLLKNFAIMCHITFDKPYKDVLAHVLKIDGFLALDDLQIDMCYNKIKIFINSNLVGFTEDPHRLFTTLKLLKLNNIIDMFTSISWHVIPNEIHILTESGRCCRPVYVIHRGKLLIEDHIKDVKAGRKGWHDLLGGKTPPTRVASYDIKALEKTMVPIEFIDVEETSCSLIAMDPSCLVDGRPYTHCEIHPSTILSVLTLNIPLCQHNQAPRNIFSGAQGKQAIGIYATNFNDRIDTMSYVLHYPQRSLVNTRYMEYMRNNNMPHGENLIVAIATYTGYNQEDSIIINKNSIQRGCFNLTYFKNMIEKEETDDKTHITFKNTVDMVMKDNLNVTGIRQGNYKKIDENGFPILNSYITESDVIFGKCCVTYQEQEQEQETLSIFDNKVKVASYQDKSVIADKTVSGIIDKVFVYFDEQDQRTCKVRFRKIRQPELGDKLCSRTAQKGVIGMIVPQEAMPFNKDGIVPDIIINPHAFPTRMTIGHLLECLVAKTAVNIGTCIDGTPFNNNNYDDCSKILESFGLEKHCNEIMYCGFTGNQIECEIFFGPTYYERLKHMVADKINYRNTGPVTNKTRQPTKGRGNGGGLRIGEMERDSVLAHGACSFLKESLMERSDIYEFFVDKKTGFIANKEGFDTVRVKAPCAFRLMLQEVAAMSVKPYLEFDSGEDMSDSDGAEDAEVNRMMADEDHENLIAGLDADLEFKGVDQEDEYDVL
jgi:DNA-directed RNA polymerase II subunit RPB2